MKRNVFMVVIDHQRFGPEFKSNFLSLCHDSFIYHRIVWELRFQSRGHKSVLRVRLSSKGYEVSTTCGEIDDTGVKQPERTMRLTERCQAVPHPRLHMKESMGIPIPQKGPEAVRFSCQPKLSSIPLLGHSKVKHTIECAQCGVE